MSEVRQIEYQRDTDEKFDKVFKYIFEHEEVQIEWLSQKMRQPRNR